METDETGVVVAFAVAAGASFDMDQLRKEETFLDNNTHQQQRRRRRQQQPGPKQHTAPDHIQAAVGFVAMEDYDCIDMAVIMASFVVFVVLVDEVVDEALVTMMASPVAVLVDDEVFVDEVGVVEVVVVVVVVDEAFGKDIVDIVAAVDYFDSCQPYYLIHEMKVTIVVATAADVVPLEYYSMEIGS